jgi:hypothetical protein
MGGKRIHALWLTPVVVFAGVVFSSAAAASAQTSETGFQASAYGTQVSVGSAVKSGRSALSVLGCVAQTGVSHTNTAASVSAPPALTSGTIDTSVASQSTASGVAAASSSRVQSASLLGGLVSATVVKSVSTTSKDSTTGAFGVSAIGTKFVGLKVAGHSVSGTPKPNTKMNLPGVGYVILNQQKSRIGKQAAGLTVIAIRVVVTKTTSAAAAGTQAEVAFAASSLGGPVTGLLTGLAYGASANVGKTVIAGEQFPQPLACLGTNGKTKTNSAASVTIPGVLTSGTISDTAEGVATAATVSGEVTSTVQGLNLGSGTVKATAVKADVTASGNPPALGDKSSFLGLSVAGHPGIGDQVAPNTKVPLSGIGTLWLHRVIKTVTGIKVTMIQLQVTVSGNPLGLKAGTMVNVAVARIGVH